VERHDDDWTSAESAVGRNVGLSLWRGVRGRCPRCGRGRLFCAFIKVDDHCSVCRLDFTGHRADDLPAYLVIVIVGHVLVPVILWIEVDYAPSLAFQLGIYLPISALASISPATGQRRRGGAAMVAQDARLRRAPARRTPGLRRKVPQRNGAGEPGASASNFIRSIIALVVEAGRTRIVVTRFPPEPNGYLHLGHAKSIVLNYELAKEFGGRCNLRLDDTNPAKERAEYSDAIKRDVQWLGFDLGQGLHFAYAYFEQLYAWACHLISIGKAYVDDQSAHDIREGRGTLTSPGRTMGQAGGRPDLIEIRPIEAIDPGPLTAVPFPAIRPATRQPQPRRDPGGPEVVGGAVGRGRGWRNSRRDEAGRTGRTH